MYLSNLNLSNMCRKFQRPLIIRHQVDIIRKALFIELTAFLTSFIKSQISPGGKKNRKREQCQKTFIKKIQFVVKFVNFNDFALLFCIR
jgi:hypothetical protein